MPEKLESSILNLENETEEKWKHISLNCLWTSTSHDTSLTVFITCLNCTFSYEFFVRVIAYPLGAPNVSKQIDLYDDHSLLRSLTDALNFNEVFPELHLNAYQLENLEEPIEYLDLNFYWSIMAQPHLTYPDLAVDKFSGTDPDQNADAFNHLTECKINSALGTEPDPCDLEHFIYLNRKKALFSSLLRGPAAGWYGSTIQDAKTWNEVRTLFITKFSDGRNNCRHRMEVEHCIRADGEEIRDFLFQIEKTVDKGWPEDMVGATATDQEDGRAAEARQRRERYIDYTLKGLRSRYLQRKAQE